MGMSIRCHFAPEVPGVNLFLTDGKNLLAAYLSAALGGLDLDELAHSSDVDMPGDVPDVFSPLDPFIDKSVMLGGGFTTLHAPSDGLAAVTTTVKNLRGDAGAIAVPNSELRAAAIADLEHYATMLQTAEQHGASFSFYLNL